MPDIDQVPVYLLLQLYELKIDDVLTSELKQYDNMVMLLQAKHVR